MQAAGGSNGSSIGDHDFLLGDMELYFSSGAGNDIDLDDSNEVNESVIGDDFVFSDVVDGLEGGNGNEGIGNNTDGDIGANKGTSPLPLMLGSGGGDSGPFFPVIPSSSASSHHQETQSSIPNTNSSPSSFTQPWHLQDSSKIARQSMILEIARLLKSRKKSRPSDEWLQQLPHKARKLEERLFRAAPSLSAYQDLSTLKNRLRKVAQIITNQYEASRSQRPSGFNSSSFTTSNSFGSPQSSSYPIRDSVTSTASFGSVQSSPGIFQTRDSVTSNASAGTVGTLNERLAGMGAVSSLPSQLGSVSSSGDQSRNVSLKSSPEGVFSGTAPNPKPQTTGDTRPSYRVPVPQNQIASSTPSTPSNSQTMLEQQKAINEKLRMEIQENIRKQNELFQKLQQQQNLSQNGPSMSPVASGINQQQQNSTASAISMPLNQAQQNNPNGSNFNFDHMQRRNSMPVNARSISVPGGNMGANHMVNAQGGGNATVQNSMGMAVPGLIGTMGPNGMTSGVGNITGAMAMQSAAGNAGGGTTMPGVVMQQNSMSTGIVANNSYGIPSGGNLNNSMEENFRHAQLAGTAGRAGMGMPQEQSGSSMRNGAMAQFPYSSQVPNATGLTNHLNDPSTTLMQAAQMRSMLLQRQQQQQQAGMNNHNDLQKMLASQQVQQLHARQQGQFGQQPQAMPAHNQQNQQFPPQQQQQLFRKSSLQLGASVVPNKSSAGTTMDNSSMQPNSSGMNHSASRVAMPPPPLVQQPRQLQGGKENGIDSPLSPGSFKW